VKWVVIYISMIDIGLNDAIYSTFRNSWTVKNGNRFGFRVGFTSKIYSTEEIKIETTEDEKFKIIDLIKKSLKKSNK